MLIKSIPTVVSSKNLLELTPKTGQIISNPSEHLRFLSPIFVGREEMINSIIENNINDTNKRFVAFVEKGGQGKTALAAHLADKIQKQAIPATKHVFVADLKNESPLSIGLRWLRAIGQNYDGEEEITVLNKLREVLIKTPCVIIYDNCYNIQSLNKVLINSPNVFSIITTRDRNIVPEEFEFVDVKELDLQSSLELLTKIIGEDRIKSNHKAATQICEICSGLPLALKIAGGTLRNRARWGNLDKYVERLSNSTMNTLSGGTNSDTNIRRTFKISYENLSDDLRNVFNSLGFFKNNTFSLEAVTSMFQSDKRHDIECLCDLSLIDELDNNKFHVHDLVLLFAEEKLNTLPIKSDLFSYLLAYYSEFLSKNHTNYEVLDTEIVNILGLVGNDNLKTETDLDNIFSIIGNLHRYLKDRGLWNELLELGNITYTVFEKDQTKKAFVSGMILSWIHFQKGQFEEAKKHAEESLIYYDSISDPIGEATAKRRVGMSLLELGDYNSAEKWLNEAKSEFEKNDNLIKVGDTICLLALLKRKTGDSKTCKQLLDEGLELVKDDAKETSMIYYGLGRYYYSISDFDNSINYHKKSLSVDIENKRKPGIAYNMFRIGQIEIKDAEKPDYVQDNLIKAKDMFEELGNLKRVNQIDALLKGL